MTRGAESRRRLKRLHVRVTTDRPHKTVRAFTGQVNTALFTCPEKNKLTVSTKNEAASWLDWTEGAAPQTASSKWGAVKQGSVAHGLTNPLILNGSRRWVTLVCHSICYAVSRVGSCGWCLWRWGDG